MLKIKIRTMGTQHLNEVVILEKICFSVPWAQNSLAAEINNPDSYFLVAVDENENVAGYVGLKFVLDEGYITNLAVFPQYRKNGVAKKLLNNVLEFGIVQNLRFISLEVRKSNICAINLYEKFNFLHMGERKNFYSYPKENAIIMTRFLS